MPSKSWLKRNKWRILVMFLFLATVAMVLALSIDKQRPVPNTSKTSKSTPKTKPKTTRTFNLVDLQPTIEAWAAKQSGTASIVIYDLANNKTIASLNPNTQYFTASIYKIYVAYIAYQKIAQGTYNYNEPYLASYSRGKCLDLMIRESYSPCGEKWWNELGKANLTAKLKTYGLKNTDMTGLVTSAKDASIILERLFDKSDLAEKYRKLYLSSMKNQPAIYRRGLPSGFTKSTVYNKVGWNEQIEWHDTAIVTLPNGHSFVICILTKNVGSTNIAELGRMIETKLL